MTASLRFAVVGDPVEHSRSPDLHARFLAEAGITGSYDRIRVPAGDLARTVAELRRRGFFGLNVTTPLKEEAYALARELGDLARITGSVNTLTLDARTRGDNTDGAGVLGVLADAGLGPPAGKRVLVIGAGPTARAAIAALVATGARVVIWNRTAARAGEVADRYGAEAFVAGTPVDAVFAAIPPNAAPHDDAVRETILTAPIFVDANYGSRATLAADLDRAGIDGSRMLEHSARASFELWHRALRSRVAS